MMRERMVRCHVGLPCSSYRSTQSPLNARIEYLCIIREHNVYSSYLRRERLPTSSCIKGLKQISISVNICRTNLLENSILFY